MHAFQDMSHMHVCITWTHKSVTCVSACVNGAHQETHILPGRYPQKQSWRRHVYGQIEKFLFLCKYSVFLVFQDSLPDKITYLDCSFSSLLLLSKNASLFIMWQCSQCKCLNFSFILLSTHHYIFTKSESSITLFEKYLVMNLKIKEIIFH